MKKKISIFLSVTLFLVFGANMQLNGNCVSPNGYEDNAKCNKSDINNKYCEPGSPYDCYIPPMGGPNQ